MDIFVSLLILAVVYLGPALLKHYRATLNKAQVPIAPPEQQVVAEVTPSNKMAAKYVTSSSEGESIMAAANASSPVDDYSVRRSKLDDNMIINGFIFAEILLPPRAYRPFRRPLK